MKNIFRGIGILVSIFTIFFFLLIVDKMVYHNDNTIYDFNLNKSISGQELKKIVEITDVTVRLVHFKNKSFGKKELEVTFINPDSTISLGKQHSVFPKNNIVYHIFDEKKEKQIQYFTILDNDYNKIKKIKLLLEKYGFDVDIDKTEPLKFSLSILFSPLNLEFFALLIILLILSIATYYVHRLKEIGILKLSGWSNKNISFHLLADLLSQLYIFSLIFIIPFSIYIMVCDKSKIILYFKIYLELCFFLALVFIISAFIGTFFIHKINRVSAIKNKKNNKLIFNILVLFKIFATILLIISMNYSIEYIYRLNATFQDINKMQKYDLYKIHTSVAPDETLQEKLKQIIDSLSDKNVYNYCVPDNNFDILKIKSYQSSGKLREYNNEMSFTSISPNILDLLDILDERGRKIEVTQIDSTGNNLLIPIHYKNEVENILKYFGLEKNTTIIYIQNGQTQNDITYPGYYVYDSIYYIHKVQKVLYLNSGEVFLNKESAKKVEQKLNSLSIDTNSIRIDSLNAEYDIIKGNAQLRLYDSLFFLIINILSFLLCVVSIVTIFLELRKKEFGVYKLIGKYPSKVIGKFVILNWMSTVLIALTVNPILILLVLIEGAIHVFLISKYMRSKAVLALKGE